jgi:hypothetical protein
VHALSNEVDRAGVAAHQGLYTVSGAAVAALYIAASLILFPAVATLLMLELCAALRWGALKQLILGQCTKLRKLRSSLAASVAQSPDSTTGPSLII